jgi:hypothetical protein
MLAIHCLRRTSRHLVINTSRSTFSTLPYPKSSEIQTGTSINYSELHKANRDQLDDLKKSVPANDVLEAKRLETEQIKNKTPVVTSTEKFASGLSPIQSTSSITPTGDGLFHNTKVSDTPVAPGIPVTSNVPPLGNEQHSRKEEQIPSSRFSAFLRSIRSGLPFFPSRKNLSSTIDIATTREYFIPVCTYSSF